MRREEYELIDSGNGQKLERFGPYTLIRPCSQALWKTSCDHIVWENADATFTRDDRWKYRQKLPDSWHIEVKKMKLRIHPTDFGHLGFFPEHTFFWNDLSQLREKNSSDPLRLLNLFAYSGSTTMFAASCGIHTTHVDASKGMVDWAKENMNLNSLTEAPIRWIIDDVMKFLKREERRQSFYDMIILDPPSFGRGSKGEVFKIEEEITPLLEACKNVLSERACFFLCTCHTPGMTPLVMQHLFTDVFKDSQFLHSGEMVLPHATRPVPSGSFALWRKP